jgi:hypothetical protein
MNRSLFSRFLPLLAAVAALSLSSAAAHAAHVTINNVDAPGIGFNDPTPVAPVGGNPGTTLGEQRRIVFAFAADLWGATLDSGTDIVVQATFQPLACDPTSGVLGSAGPLQVFAFDTPAPPGIRPLTWYTVAQANALAGVDLTPGPPDPGLLEPPYNDDIVAFFNGAIGVDPGCLTGLGWYYGLDNAAAANQIDLLNVVAHEFAHGLGFLDLADDTDGSLFLGLPDIYGTRMYDSTLRKTWDVMTDAERLFSQVNTGHLVWGGYHVRHATRRLMDPRTSVGILKPRSLRDSLEAQPASFGPPLERRHGTSAEVALADDGVGVGTDACQPITSHVHDRIALVDRGGCTFTVKVKNAQDAGAVGVIVVNNAAKGLPGMGGSDPTIVIPSVGISLADGTAIKAALASGDGGHGHHGWNRHDDEVVATLFLDPRYRQGADEALRMKLYAPDPVEPGSSKSHWDTTATPNLLMEPFINSDLKASETLDLTPSLMRDLGWRLLH